MQYSDLHQFNKSYQEDKMGRGDRRTRKGKIARKSYGNTRTQKTKKTTEK